jgi:endonuclease YncB( thermonuclease family)
MAEARLLVALALALAGCDVGAATETGSGDEVVSVHEAGAPSGPRVVAEGDAFTCTPVKLWDGDGPIQCAEGPKVRLAGIAAREMDGSCSPGHPCPEASAQDARDTLAGLLGRTTGTASTGHLLIEGPALQCLSEGSGKGSRTAAWCVSPDAGDLSCAMVASGMAEKWDRYWREEACS